MGNADAGTVTGGVTRSTLCRRCFLHFGSSKSPVCEHVFCASCFDKSVGGESSPFRCFACDHRAANVDDSTAATAGDASASFVDHIGDDTLAACANHELLRAGTALVAVINCDEFRSPRSIAATRDGTLAVVDSDHVIVFDSDGAMRKRFAYLHGYTYQGGFAAVGEDTLLVAIRNEKYNSVSFYATDGTFKYSAFLNAAFEGVTLAVNSDDTIIVVSDSCDGHAICLIDREKAVHEHTLSDRVLEVDMLHKTNEYGCSSTSAGPIGICVDSRNNIVTLHQKTESRTVTIYDDKYEAICRFQCGVSELGANVELAQTGTTIAREDISIDKNDCLILTSKSRNKVHLFCLDGRYIQTLVQYREVYDITSMRGIVCFGDNKLAVLLSGGFAGRGQIRIYTYCVAKRYRHRIVNTSNEPLKNQVSVCCNVL